MADDEVPAVRAFLETYVRRLDFSKMTLNELRAEGPSLVELTDQFSIREARMFELWEEFVAAEGHDITLTPARFADILFDSFNADLVPNVDGGRRWLGYVNDADA